MITADHGCDPAYTRTTDHTREYTPFLLYGRNVIPGNMGTRDTFTWSRPAAPEKNRACGAFW